MNDNNPLQVDVCIVGAGPGGALLSYLLNRQGISTALIERQPHLHKSFRGELLNQDGEAVLSKHGLYSGVAQLGAMPLEQIQYWENGQIIHTVYPGEENRMWASTYHRITCWIILFHNHRRYRTITRRYYLIR